MGTLTGYLLFYSVPTVTPLLSPALVNAASAIKRLLLKRVLREQVSLRMAGLGGEGRGGEGGKGSV